MDVANEIMKESKEAEVNELDRQFQSLGMEEMTRCEFGSFLAWIGMHLTAARIQRKACALISKCSIFDEYRPYSAAVTPSLVWYLYHWSL